MDYLKHPQMKVRAMGLLLVCLLGCSCSNMQTAKMPDSAHAARASEGGQLTQYEAERSAIAEFEKYGGGAKIISHKFDKLVYKDFPPGHSTMNGYFLCGQIEYRDPRGRKYGPMRIMVYTMKDFRPAAILYDYPELGRHEATTVCDQVQTKDNQPPNGE